MSAHRGSVYWNEYRKRWVMIAVESAGTSFLGEVWFAESDTPLGPWVYARKVVTHDRYSFYNPKQHPMLDKGGGRTLFFEGTYTRTFSGNPDATPRYDYNQIMYRLNLDDARLNLPVPVYRRRNAGRRAELPDRPSRRGESARPRSPVLRPRPLRARHAAGLRWRGRTGEADSEPGGTSRGGRSAEATLLRTPRGGRGIARDERRAP